MNTITAMLAVMFRLLFGDSNPLTCPKNGSVPSQFEARMNRNAVITTGANERPFGPAVCSIEPHQRLDDDLHQVLEAPRHQLHVAGRHDREDHQHRHHDPGAEDVVADVDRSQVEEHGRYEAESFAVFAGLFGGCHRLDRELGDLHALLPALNLARLSTARHELENLVGAGHC